jgi:protein TonB
MLSLSACAGSENASGTDGDRGASASERAPELIGGLEALYRELEYPESAREEEREGRAIIQFVVSPEGKAVGVRVLNSSGTRALDHEAQRVVRETDWRPGMKDGEPVQVQMVLPINFEL